MVARGNEVKDTAMRAEYIASVQKRLCNEQIVASNAICDAIPNGNNV
jgi:hypothetical protein